MTKRFNLKGFKSLITLAVVFMMTVALAFTVACNSDDSSSSSSSSSSGSSTSTVSDSHTLLNGNFEYYAEGDTVSFPYKSSIKWTNTRGYIVSSSNSAPSSSATSGIIDTEETAYGKLLEKDAFSGKKLSDFLGTFNPHSPSYFGYTDKDADAPEGSGERVLMIHNRIKDKEKQGTAQYFYTSGSTLSLKAGQYGKLTVWVNTYDLKSEIVTNDFGAYVKLVNKVGSTEAAPAMVKNINTNGNWAKVEIYLEASDLATANYTLYLGLGLGSDKITDEYAEGFAFFDDVTFDVYEKTDKVEAEKTAKELFDEVDAANKKDAFETNADGESALVDEIEYTAPAAYTTNDKNDKNSYTTATYALTHKAAAEKLAYTSTATDINKEAFKDQAHLNSANAGTSVSFVAKTAVTAEGVFDNEKTEFADTDMFAYFDFTNTASSRYILAKDYSVAAGKTVLLTFWAKVNVETAHKTATGLTVTLLDTGNVKYDVLASEEKAISTEVVAATTETTTDNNGWKMYSVLIQNDTKTVDANGKEQDAAVERYYTLKLNFGPTALSDAPTAFPKGYALVGAAEQTLLGETTSSIYSANSTVSLKGEIKNVAKDNEDSYAFNAKDYEIAAGMFSAPVSSDISVYNPSEETGVFNTQYLPASISTVEQIKNLEKMTGNDYVQALLINANNGYYAKKATTVGANTLAKITVKLATINGAKAVVSVLDRNNTLTEGKGFAVASLKDFKEGLVAENTPAEEKLTRTISGKDGKWVEVTFYVAAGTKDLSLGFDIWNGERYSETAATGYVVVESVSVTTASSETFETIKDTFSSEKGYNVEKINTFGYTATSYNKAKYDKDKTEEIVTSENENGEKENVYTTYEGLGLVLEATNSDGDIVLYTNFLATDFEDKVFVEVTDSSDTSDTSSSSSSSSSSSDGDELPGEVQWLAISSIIIAAVLIVALVAIVVRYFVKKSAAKRVKTVSYYDTEARERTNRKISANKAKAAAEGTDDEAEEYDYDEANSIEETAEETEETTEETEATEEAEAATEETAEPAEETTETAEETTETAETTETETTETTETTAAPAEEEKKDNE